jgi:hypothetical protein
VPASTRQVGYCSLVRSELFAGFTLRR